VRAHRIADVPVGAFLSGGLDSAGIVALMTRLGATRLKTFSLVFEETAYSEAEPARRAAQALGTEHHETVLTGRQIVGDLDRLIQAFDQPTGDGINTYYVSQAARAGGVTVALSGLGGDELFGGYPSFRDLPRLARWLAGWRLLPAAVRTALAQRLGRGGSGSANWRTFSGMPGTWPTCARCSAASSPPSWAARCFIRTCATRSAPHRPAIRPGPSSRLNSPRRTRSRPSTRGNSARTWLTYSCGTVTS